VTDADLFRRACEALYDNCGCPAVEAEFVCPVDQGKAGPAAGPIKCDRAGADCWAAIIRQEAEEASV